MISWRFPPTFMVAIPSSQPLMTCPAPKTNSIGRPRVMELSKTVPSSTFPVEWSLTFWPLAGAAPVPIFSSMYFKPEGVTVAAGAFLGASAAETIFPPKTAAKTKRVRPKNSLEDLGMVDFLSKIPKNGCEQLVETKNVDEKAKGASNIKSFSGLFERYFLLLNFLRQVPARPLQKFGKVHETLGLDQGLLGGDEEVKGVKTVDAHIN